MPERHGLRRRHAARPLYGYRDIGTAGARHSRRAVVRSVVILVIMLVIYLAITLTIYFVEPGLR
jgi:hypothetical protein